MRDTCRPSGALGYLRIPPGYKHVAPLGLSPKTGKRGNGIDLIRNNDRCSLRRSSTAEALAYLVYLVCYKHVAPLEL